VVDTPEYPDMKGKVALVTGGSSGIGLATASAFARQGAVVVIASRGEAAAKTALKVLTKAGDAQWLPVDVADGKSVARLIDRIMSAYGHATAAAVGARPPSPRCLKAFGVRPSTDI